MNKESPAGVRVSSGLPALAGDARGGEAGYRAPDAARLQAWDDYLSAKSKRLDEYSDFLRVELKALADEIREQRQLNDDLGTLHRSLVRWCDELAELDPRMRGTIH